MLQEYISRAMDTAECETMEDGRIFCHVPAMPGAWAEGATVESCLHELREVVEGWILVATHDQGVLPVMGGIDINVRETADASQ